MKKFIVVASGKSLSQKLIDGFKGNPSEDKEMHTFSDETNVLHFLCTISTASGDSRKVDKIFSVDHEGKIEHYAVVFSGRMLLKAVTPEFTGAAPFNGGASVE
jgi:hypothetical protein